MKMRLMQHQEHHQGHAAHHNSPWCGVPPLHNVTPPHEQLHGVGPLTQGRWVPGVRQGWRPTCAWKAPRERCSNSMILLSIRLCVWDSSNCM